MNPFASTGPGVGQTGGLHWWEVAILVASVVCCLLAVGKSLGWLRLEQAARRQRSERLVEADTRAALAPRPVDETLRISDEMRNGTEFEARLARFDAYRERLGKVGYSGQDWWRNPSISQLLLVVLWLAGIGAAAAYCLLAAIVVMAAIAGRRERRADKRWRAPVFPIGATRWDGEGDR